jgi:hypothetical protein
LRQGKGLSGAEPIVIDDKQNSIKIWLAKMKVIGVTDYKRKTNFEQNKKCSKPLSGREEEV